MREGIDVIVAGRSIWMRARHAAVAGALCLLVLAIFDPPAALAGSCPNEQFRVGRSAALPDCRAYELVTPEELGRTEDMTFTGEDHAIGSPDGEHLALETLSPFGPNPSDVGARVIFARTSSGWTMNSIVPSGKSGVKYFMRLFSPNLSQVAFETEGSLNFEYSSNTKFEAGPIGGPYTLVTEVSPANRLTQRFTWMGANNGAGGVPPFTDVLFTSGDHQLLPPGPERTVAEETIEGAGELYEMTDGHLHLIGLSGAGKLLSRCGAELGSGIKDGGAPTKNAISADGSKVFFQSPETSDEGACNEPARLYMQEAGQSEPVEVSAPQGVTVASTERLPVRYDGATADGSKVFFTTGMRLVPEAPQGVIGTYEYNTEAPLGTRLKLAYTGYSPGEGWSNIFLLSEDGSTVYYGNGYSVLRYDARTGTTTPVARWGAEHKEKEPSYATPNGEFLTFAASGTVEGYTPHGFEAEPRGHGENQLYRYDAANGSVTCVSCGEGSSAPAEGFFLNSDETAAVEEEMFDGTPEVIEMSENGQEVFFETTAKLVPQDINTSAYFGSSRINSPGADVYEWEADGWDGCTVAVGCTYLISSGEDQGPSYFLGASSNGRDLFFSSAARLVSWATPEFTNIYDARVDGGFAPPPTALECTSCQGVGSTAPLFGPGASLTFVGAGNPVAPTQTGPVKGKAKSSRHRCGKGRHRVRGRCVKAGLKSGRRARRSRAKSGRGGRR